MNELTPKQIVARLDDYIIGQTEAKKAIAVALRNRYRRMHLPDDMKNEVTPKNLLMIGPTGVGKTEIARRLAKIVNAPFVKVEATKFTEVGYVGRDVESMVRDLVDQAYQIEEQQAIQKVRPQALKKANQKLVKLLVPAKKAERKQQSQSPFDLLKNLNSGNFNLNDMLQPKEDEPEQVDEKTAEERMSVAEQLQKGFLEDELVTISVAEQGTNAQNPMLSQLGIDVNSALAGMMPQRMVKRTLPVKEAREILIRQEATKMTDQSQLGSQAVRRAENTGIIFIDEIDKITSTNKSNSGEVSREGVQRDILPIVEGSQVNTKYGMINTDHILFIGSGAFQVSKPSDLIAELQGRFPIRVELADLSEQDFVKILTEPSNALIKQYKALIATDNISVTFTKEAVEAMAKIAYQLNHQTENIGARRLHTILEKLLEDLLYEGPDMQMGEITITEKYVNDKLAGIVANKDLSEFIL